MKPRAEIGVFGGSGFYSFIRGARGVAVRTPYGSPSAKVTLSEIGGKKVAFIPRHGAHHEYPPHKVPYRANLMAFKQMGASRVIAPNAVGSLKADIRPGDFVFCDQFINFTSGREGTYYDGPVTTHVGMAHPYCPQMREIAVEAARELRLRFRANGTMVVIQGPRFSTTAESRFFSRQGWEVIGMTQYPEVVLAREQELCYLNISLVTDYDVGLEGDPSVKPVSNEAVIRVFNSKMESLRKLIVEIVKALPEERKCACGSALKGASVNA